MIDTLPQLVLNTFKEYPKDNFILFKKEGTYLPLSTAAFSRPVTHLSLGLQAIGFGPG